MFIQIPHVLFVSELENFISEYDCIYWTNTQDEHPFTSYLKEQLCSRNSDEFLKAFALSLREANVDNLYADYGDSTLYLTTIASDGDKKSELTDLGKQLFSLFSAYWKRSIVALRKDWAAITTTKLTNEIVDFIRECERWSSYSLCQRLIEQSTVHKTVTSLDFIFLERADAEWMCEFGIRDWLSKRKTGLDVVVANPTGKIGKSYRRLNQSLQSVAAVLKQSYPEFALPQIGNELLIERLIREKQILSDTDGRSFIGYFLTSEGFKEWEHFLEKVSLESLCLRAEIPVPISRKKSPIFVEEFKPIVSWFSF